MATSSNGLGKEPLICHRCGCELTPGSGGLWFVRIDAVADPTPPDLSAADLLGQPADEIQRLIRQMAGLSKQELMDQVYRRLVIHLCNQCFRSWIENPTG